LPASTEKYVAFVILQRSFIFIFSYKNFSCISYFFKSDRIPRISHYP